MTESDMVVNRDYMQVRGRMVTYSMVEQFVQGIRDELLVSSGKLKAVAIEGDTKSDGYELTNYLGEVGAILSRAYALSREAKAYRDVIDRTWDDLSNEAYEAKLVSGTNKDARRASMATMYPAAYKSLRYLNDFIDHELADYVLELSTMNIVLSRQVSSVELEYNISGGRA